MSPELGKGLQTLGNAPAKTGHLPAKMHELISLAVAVTTRCDGCIASHVKAAVEQGATREELAETLAVAIPLNARSRRNLLGPRFGRVQRILGRQTITSTRSAWKLQALRILLR
ncbi:MAG TPA: carboxymuconolactone decarboxylase family protein [Terriglobales bacterium]|nr:carboxymuconolactone decarboxylase family protein [Terriglobales bacterium]